MEYIEAIYNRLLNEAVFFCLASSTVTHATSPQKAVTTVLRAQEYRYIGKEKRGLYGL